MSNHTPGPWLYGPFGAIWPASDVEFIEGKWREKCAEPRIITNPSQVVPEAEANGRLMAAAPELLEAIRGLVGLFDGGKSWSPEDHPVVVARAAIAKAEGRS